MKNQEVSLGGAVVFWSAGATDRNELNRRLKEMFLEDYQCEPRTDFSALRSSLEDYAKSLEIPGRKVLVRPNKDAQVNGFSVVVEDQLNSRVEPRMLFSVKVRRIAVPGVEGLTNPSIQLQEGSADVNRVMSRFTAWKQVLDGTGVGQLMVRMLNSLGAVCLRDRGGIYWIPEESLVAWNMFVSQVELSAMPGSETRCYQLSTAIDDHAVRAVGDAVVKEVESAANGILNELRDGREHSPEWYERRQKASSDLMDRVTWIEDVLNTQMTDLKQVVKDAKRSTAEATANLMYADF